MAFWSGSTIRRRLSELVDKPDPDNVDGAAYTLSVGPEYYVTPTDRDLDPKTRSVKQLAASECFAIPPGQFAYVMTDEVITLPTEVLGFISIRARIKWKGLVNVSGFHVDPGFKGRLTFSVFNAGPGSIHLRRGDPAFLIWFADLDADAGDDAKQMTKPTTLMDIGIVNQVTGELASLQSLSEKLKAAERDLRDQITEIKRANAPVQIAAALVIAFVVAVGGRWAYELIFPTEPAPAAGMPASSASADVRVRVDHPK